MALATDYSTVKKTNLYLGAATLAVGCAMAFEFGRSMSYLHALSLCCLSIAVAFLPSVVHKYFQERSWGVASVLGVITVAFIAVEFFSHLGYTVGHRVRDAEEATVQNTTYSAVQDNLASEKENLAMWRKQLADLKAQNAWTASVTADALRAKLEVANEKIRQEEARGGCGPVCLRLKTERADLNSRIATVESVENLAKQIAATQKIIDGKVDTAKTTEFKSSKIVNQTKFVSQLMTMSLEPDKSAFTWSQIGIGFMIALVTTFLAPVCFFVAFADRKPGVAHDKAAEGTLLRPASQPIPSPVTAPVPSMHGQVVVGSELARRIAARLGPRQLSAA